MIPVTARLALDERELHESFLAAQGPGGQNVNKVATAVELRFDLLASPSLPAAVKERAARLAGQRLNQAGEIVIRADRHRSRERNREDALQRLIELLRLAARPPPPPRRATRPGRAAVERRLEAKHRRSGVKSGRGRPRGED